MVDHYDAIVVGAGPGGSSAALWLARRGYEVLLLEKARVPGHRNMTGGVLFTTFYPPYGIRDLIPELEEEAPLERRVKEHTIHILSAPKGDGSYSYYTIDRGSWLMKLGLVKDPSTGRDYTVLRSRFDRWLAEKAADEGAMLATECTVEDLLLKDGKVVGVRTTNEELLADVVIDASGVTSYLPERLGLRRRLGPEAYYHGVKHVYRLNSRSIEERFGLGEGEGVAQFYLGYFMKGVKGGGFLYTNRDTLSVGLVLNLDSYIERCYEDLELGKPLDLLISMEDHPLLRQYLEGAELVEYSAHNVPKGPKCLLKRPYHHGFLVVGDALGSFVKLGSLIDGMRRAIATGIMAAEVIDAAKREGDLSIRGLARYKELLRPIYRDVLLSRLDALLTESTLGYQLLPTLLLLSPFKKKGQASPLGEPKKEGGDKDALQMIQERTGLLTYHEDKEYSHIGVNYEFCSRSRTKPWIPSCPFNCYTLVLEKGLFASFKDLYYFNLKRLAEEKKREDEAIKREAATITRSDIAKAKVRFDHVACVGCGTCGALGPPEAIIFGHERNGHGVRYSYG